MAKVLGQAADDSLNGGGEAMIWKALITGLVSLTFFGVGWSWASRAWSYQAPTLESSEPNLTKVTTQKRSPALEDDIEL